MTSFLKFGDKYTCMHFNPAYIDWEWLVHRSLQSNGTEESVPTELHRNIFIVGQQDKNCKQLLEKLLIEEWGWQSGSFSIFTLNDLMDTEIPESDQNEFLQEHFVRRGAISKVLCGAEYAASFVGEYWSGFTHTLLAKALVDGPFANGYTVQLYGPRRVNGNIMNYMTANYMEQLRALNMRPPPWVHIVGYSEYVCERTWQCRAN
eukprot:gnl/TRDRNA2_/TRDRNA2_174612_c0_seq13.p1 gnl/TRDRNA2_/TRDRNA2_174612_c0~~gnl/TRDRNA2_/TRDRNA2_174612_c0_seq13.p1  ORF type:complete len:205 (-),score=15.31 gnl/TRDRNA2_/TRDRNA2_174612_c0_seq13:171-785(-)